MFVLPPLCSGDNSRTSSSVDLRAAGINCRSAVATFTPGMFHRRLYRSSGLLSANGGDRATDVGRSATPCLRDHSGGPTTCRRKPTQLHSISL